MAYYTPLVLVRYLTSPTRRKRAVAKHETGLSAYREAVSVAEKLVEEDGYSPISVGDDGYFELKAPPPPGSTSIVLNDDDDKKDGSKEDMANAMADAVERAMEINNSYE